MAFDFLTYLTKETKKTTEEFESLKEKLPKESVKNDEEFETIYRYACAKQKLELFRKIKRLPEYLALEPGKIQIDDELLELGFFIEKLSGDSSTFEDILYKPFVDDSKEVVRVSKILASYVKQKRELLRDNLKPREVKLEELKNLTLSTNKMINNPIFETLPGLLDVVDIENYTIYNLNRMAAAKTRKEFNDIMQKIRDDQINEPSGMKM